MIKEWLYLIFNRIFIERTEWYYIVFKILHGNGSSVEFGFYVDEIKSVSPRQNKVTERYKKHTRCTGKLQSHRARLYQIP